MSNKKTLFMRIGSDKAGTVTLANLIDDNRDLFQRLGIFTPIRNCIPLYDYFIKIGKLKTIDFFDPTKWFETHQSSKIYFNQLIYRNETYVDYDIFLTTETFWGRLSKKNIIKCKNDIIRLCEEIKRFFPDYHVRIILHLRRADLYYESLYKQAIKAGRSFRNGIADIIKKDLAQNCMELLLILEKCFGKENIIIRPFEKQQMKNNDLVCDTLALLGVEEMSAFKVTTANESLHRDLCETLIFLNKTHGKLLPNKNLLELSDVLKMKYVLPDKKLFLSRQERLSILLEFREFYNYIEKNYCGGGPLFKDRLPGDEHLGYKLSGSLFEMIRDLILQKSEDAIATENRQRNHQVTRLV